MRIDASIEIRPRCSLGQQRRHRCSPLTHAAANSTPRVHRMWAFLHTRCSKQTRPPSRISRAADSARQDMPLSGEERAYSFFAHARICRPDRNSRHSHHQINRDQRQYLSLLADAYGVAQSGAAHNSRLAPQCWTQARRVGDHEITRPRPR